MIMSIKKPTKFHIEEATLIIKHESNTFEIQLEIRELMKICRILEKRGQYKVSDKIKSFWIHMHNVMGLRILNILIIFQ